MTSIPTTEYYRLLTASGLYHRLMSERLPELYLALVIIIILVAGLVAMAVILRSECAENKRLESVINEIHKQDAARLEIDPVSHTELEGE